MRASTASRLPPATREKCGGGCKDGAGAWTGIVDTCDDHRLALCADASCGCDGGGGGAGDVEACGRRRRSCSYIPQRRAEAQEVLRAALSLARRPAWSACRAPCDEIAKQSERSISSRYVLEQLISPAEASMQSLLFDEDEEEEAVTEIDNNLFRESDYRNEGMDGDSSPPSSPPLALFTSCTATGNLHSFTKPKLSAHSKVCEAARQAALAAGGDQAPPPRRPARLRRPTSTLTPQQKKKEEKRDPEKDSLSDLKEAMYGMVTWTEEERDFRERNICFCLKVLEFPWNMTFSDALKMGLETSILGSFLLYLNKKAKNTQDVNMDRLDIIAMNIADKKFREMLDKLDEKSLEEHIKTSKDSSAYLQKFLQSERESKKLSDMSRNSSTPLKTSEKQNKMAKKLGKALKVIQSEQKKTKTEESNKHTGKNSPPSIGTWNERREDSDEEEKDDEGEEGEMYEGPRGPRWTKPRLGDTLQALFRPSKLLFTEDSDVLDFIISSDLLLLEDQINKENVPYTRKNVIQRLRRLRLINYDMTQLDDGLQRLKQLFALSLASNWLKEVPGDLLPRSLKFLELYSNMIDDVESLTKDMPKCLLYLGLARNRISDRSNLQLLVSNTSAQLRCLDLGDNDIGQLQVTLQALCSLRHLQALRLHGNPCSISLAYSDLTLLLLPSLLYLDDVRVWPGDRKVVKDDVLAAASTTTSQSTFSNVFNLFNDSLTASSMTVASSNMNSQVPSQVKLHFDSLLKSEIQQQSSHQFDDQNQSQMRIDSRVKFNTSKMNVEDQQMKTLTELENSATRGVLIATVVRIMGLPMPPDEIFRKKKLKQLFTVELEAPLLDPVLRQPVVEEIVTAPSPPSPPLPPSPPSSQSPPTATMPPSAPSDGGEQRDDAVSPDKKSRSSAPKKGKLKKQTPDTSAKKKKSKAKIEKKSKKSKKGKKSTVTKLSKKTETTDSAFDDDDEEEEGEEMFMPPPGFEGVEDPPAKGRPLTRYCTPPSRWEPVITLDNAPIRVETPEGDLTALRDTMRSCVTMRLMFTRVLPNDDSSETKSKRGHGKDKSKDKTKKKSAKKQKKKSKELKSLKDNIKSSPSQSSLKSGVLSVLLEGLGTVLSRSTLAIFDVPLRQPLWTDNAVEYTWSVEDGQLAIPFTEGLQNILFDQKAIQRSRAASRAANESEKKSSKRKSSMSGPGSKKGKDKKSKKEKKESKGKKSKKESKEKKSPEKSSRRSQTASRMSRRTSSGLQRSNGALPLPSVPTVHIAFSVERLTPARQTVPKSEHEAWQVPSGGSEVVKDACPGPPPSTPPPRVPAPSLAPPFLSVEQSTTALARASSPRRSGSHSAAPLWWP